VEAETATTSYAYDAVGLSVNGEESGTTAN